MTLDWFSIIARFDTSAFPMPMRFEIRPHLEIVVSWYVQNEGAAPRWLESCALDVSHVETEAHAFACLRYWAQVTILHELDECIEVDGRQVWDPHRVQPVPCLHGV